jgi:virulence-associated protein VapD
MSFRAIHLSASKLSSAKVQAAGKRLFGDRGTDPVSCVLAVQALTKRYAWFRHVASDIRMLRIEENNDLMPAIGQGELLLDGSDEA